MSPLQLPAEGLGRRLRGRAAGRPRQGWLFDPTTRQYIDPATIADGDAEAVVTVASHLAEYARTKWAQWEPTTRRNAQRDLARACIYLVADDAPELTAADGAALDGYLRSAVLTGTPSLVGDDEEERWAEWLGRWSLPLGDVTDRHLQAFLEHRSTDAALEHAEWHVVRVWEHESPAAAAKTDRTSHSSVHRRRLVGND